MKRSFFSVSRQFFIAILALTIFSTVAHAQFYNYNKKTKAWTLIYAVAGYKASKLTRPRLYQNINYVRQSKSNYVKSAPQNTSNYGNSVSMEHRVFDLVNQKRMQYGLQPVMWSDDVARVARLHSANMAKYHFFNHAGIDGKRVDGRAASMGLTQWRQIGENIAYNRGFGSPLESAVDSWMNSQGHRENILSRQWQKSGVGIAMLPDGVYYFTQVFLKN